MQDIIEIRRDIILFRGQPIGKTQNGVATIDERFLSKEIARFLQPYCRSVRWESGFAWKLQEQETKSRIDLRVYQLKPEVDPLVKFAGLDSLEGDVLPENYRLVFEGKTSETDVNAVYQSMRESPPPGFSGHAVTRSDVIELQGQFYYIDTFALVPITFNKTGTGANAPVPNGGV